MMRECCEPSSWNLLMMDGSGASQSVCAVALHAIARASARTLANFAPICMFRLSISAQILSWYQPLLAWGCLGCVHLLPAVEWSHEKAGFSQSAHRTSGACAPPPD